MPTETVKTVGIRNVPKDLWKKAKIQAIDEEIKLSTLIWKALTEYLERNSA